MRFSTKSRFLAFTLCSVATAAACSSKDDVSCGEGTRLEGDTCVVDGLGGMGGGMVSSGDGDGDGDGDDDGPIVVDHDGRSPDQILVEEEFQGALAAAPISSTSVLVVWEPLEVFGLTYAIYVAQDEDDLSFGTPQYEAPQGANSFEIRGLEADETYYIAVVPVLSGVELDVGRDAVSVVPQDDDEAPSFTGVKSATPEGGAEVLLEWDAASDEESPSTAIRYLIYFSEDEDFASNESSDELEVPYAVTPPGASSFLVTGLPQPDQPYTFVVRARDAAGNVDDNAVTRTENSGEDVEPPVFAGCDFAQKAGASAITMTWQAAADDTAHPDEIIYNFYAAEGEDAADEQNFSEPSFSVVGGTSADVPGLENSTTYYIVCRAEDPSGNEEDNTRSHSATTDSDGEPPTPPVITLSESITPESIDLTWSPAEDNQSEESDIRYEIYLSDEEGEVGDLAEEVTPLQLTGISSASVLDLESNHPYYVLVRAYDLVGNFSDSTQVPVETLVSLRSDIAIDIFGQNCATPGCHSVSTTSPNPSSELRLEPNFAYSYLVGVPAVSPWAAGEELLRVNPGSPETSHLIHRIRDMAEELGGTFVKMPQNEALLSDQQVETIEKWITQGANDN